jgi:hypothetical protein
MSAGWVLPGFGASSLRALTKTLAPMHVYISERNGNDLTGLGTIDQPLATLEKLESILPDTIEHPVDVSLDSDNHVLPSDGEFLRSRAFDSTLRFFADEDWDPGVVTTITTGTAAAGTTGVSIKGVGLPVGGFDKFTIEFTTLGGVPVPLAQRQRKTVRNNTATEIIPSHGFTPAPIPGDSYRIIRCNCFCLAPTIPGPGFTRYEFTHDSPGTVPALVDGLFTLFGGLPGFTHLSGLVLEGVGLRASASFQSFTFGRHALFAYGSVLDPNGNPANNTPLALRGTGLYSGNGLTVFERFEGWGVVSLASGDGISMSIGSSMVGYYWGDGVNLSNREPGASMAILGGRAQRVGLTQGTLLFFNIPVPDSVPFRLDSANNPGSPAISITNGGFPPTNLSIQGGFELVNPSAAFPAIYVGPNGSLAFDDGLVGQGGAAGSVLVDSGAFLLLTAAPNFGDPVASDWTVVNLPAVNKSAFAAPSTGLMDPATESRVARSS